MGISDEIGDATFDAGMLAGAQALGDPGTTASGKFTPDWVPAFKQDVRDISSLSFLFDTLSRVLRRVTGAEDMSMLRDYS